MLMWCDSIILMDHASTDDTALILDELKAEHGNRVQSMRWESIIWEEMRQRDALLNAARDCGATHIGITDCDELPSGNILPRMREFIERTPRGAVLQLPWVQLKGSIQTYISSGMWSQQCASTAFPDDLAYHWTARNGYDHHHRHPMGKPINCHMPMGRSVKGGGVLHLQMASDQRLRWKQALYLLQETLRWPGRKTPAELNAMYGPTVYAPGSVLSPVPAEWWNGYEHLMKYLDVDAECWQAAECRRLWQEHGPERFAGLDLFGVELCQ